MASVGQRAKAFGGANESGWRFYCARDSPSGVPGFGFGTNSEGIERLKVLAKDKLRKLTGFVKRYAEWFV